METVTTQKLRGLLKKNGVRLATKATSGSSMAFHGYGVTLEKATRAYPNTICIGRTAHDIYGVEGRNANFEKAIEILVANGYTYNAKQGTITL